MRKLNTGRIYRHKNPGQFWYGVIAGVVFALALLSFGGYSTWQLVR